MTTAKKNIKKQASNFDSIKDEVLTLITGQKPNQSEKFDYLIMAKRVGIILIAVYGFTRLSLVRRLTMSIVSAYATRWMAEKALNAAAPALQPA